MNIGAIKDFLKVNKQPAFRLNQIMKAVYQDGASSFLEVSNIPKELREKLDSELKILSFTAEKVLEAKDKKSAKAALRLGDGQIIESVLISPLPESWSVCVSTQVGCPMNCGFCATGKGGFKRNLTAEEITDQVLFWRQYLRKSQISNSKNQINPKSKIKNPKIGNLPVGRQGWKLETCLPVGEVGNYDISNVVYMGMGEPFLNWEQVRESLKILTDKNTFGFGSRSVSVSTSGIPEGIINFAQTFPQMNLALSLHFADDQKRSAFMPVNRKYNLADVKRALQEYFTITKRKVFIEYIMLDSINDSREDAENLVRYLQSIGNAQLLHVNLIGYNATGGNWKASSGNKIHAFKSYLVQNKINATIRKSLGEEVQGACGQLAGKQ